MAKYWLLEFMNPPPGITEKHLKREGDILSIGRIEGNAAIIHWDPKISRMHARLELANNAIRVTDLKSTNGTFILENFKWRELKNPTVVQSPAVLKFGDTAITISYGEFVDVNEKDLFQSVVMSLPEVMDNLKTQESILVLDLCGSTSIAGKEGDHIAFHLKKRLFQLCDAAFKDSTPAYTKNTGDGLLTTFNSAETCMKAALAIARNINHRNRNTQNPPIHVRMGLHAGETFLIDKATQDRHGNSLNIAFRIEGVTPAAFESGIGLPERNRIIASKDFLKAYDKDREKFRLLGQAKLKGIEMPMELYLYEEEF